MDKTAFSPELVAFPIGAALIGSSFGAGDGVDRSLDDNAQAAYEEGVPLTRFDAPRLRDAASRGGRVGWSPALLGGGLGSLAGLAIGDPIIGSGIGALGGGALGYFAAHNMARAGADAAVGTVLSHMADNRLRQERQPVFIPQAPEILEDELMQTELPEEKAAEASKGELPPGMRAEYADGAGENDQRTADEDAKRAGHFQRRTSGQKKTCELLAPADGTQAYIRGLADLARAPGAGRPENDSYLARQDHFPR